MQGKHARKHNRYGLITDLNMIQNRLKVIFGEIFKNGFSQTYSQNMGKAIKAVNHRHPRGSQDLLLNAFRFADQAQILEVPIHHLGISFRMSLLQVLTL